MAVQEQTPLREYTANGVTTSFALGFDCEETNHLIVTIDDVEVLPTDWYLSGSNVVFWTAPGNGKLIKLQRNTPFNRLVDYQSYNNSFRPPAINKEFDRVWWKLQELGVADWLLRLYVDRLHQKQEDKIDNLKIYVDDKDDELRAYLLEEIRKQGVALDQLDEYYNYLMQRLAQIAVDKGWDASFVSYGGLNQKQVNDGVESIEELLAIPAPQNGTRVDVKSYHAGKGRGGGTFVWDATSTATANNGTVFAISGVAAGRWIRQLADSGFITPQMFGAKADGVTETHNELKAALQYAIDNDMQCYAPKGTYLLGGRVDPTFSNGKSLYFYGDGSELTVFKERDGLTLELGRYNMSFYFLAQSGVVINSIVLRDFKVDKNGHTSMLTQAVIDESAYGKYIYEQAHCIGISTTWTDAKIKFLDIENVTTKDKIGAGICLMAGRADVVRVRNIKGVDFQFNGGERADFEFQMHVKNLVVEDSSGRYIQSEYDRQVTTDTLRVTMKRCKYDVVDIACTSDATKQLVFLEDVQAPRLLHVRNCTVFGKYVTGQVGTISQEYWFNLGVGSEFDETCDFIIDARTDVSPRVTKPFYLRTGELTFKGRFVAGDGFDETVEGFAVNNYAFYNGSDIQHKLVLDGARFDNKFERSVNAYANGNFVIKRCKLAGRAGALNAIAVGGFSTYYSNVELEDNDLSQLGAGLLQYTATNNLFSVVFKGVHDYEKSGFTSSNQTNSNSQTKCLGSFYSTSAPGIGYQGAVVRILDPSLGEPVVYQNLTGNSVAASAVWCVSGQAGLASGNTASRPTVTSKENGLRYHNTETAKIETWNGTAWV